MNQQHETRPASLETWMKLPEPKGIRRTAQLLCYRFDQSNNYDKDGNLTIVVSHHPELDEIMQRLANAGAIRLSSLRRHYALARPAWHVDLIDVNKLISIGRGAIHA